MGKRGPPPEDIPGLDIFVRGIVDWMRDGRPGGIKISQAINEFAAANGCSAPLIWKRVEEAQQRTALPLPPFGPKTLQRDRTPTFVGLKKHIQWLQAAGAKDPNRPLVEGRTKELRERMAEIDGKPGWLTWKP